jgi:hypothetical protein
MKIRSNLRAGDALAQCQKERDYWKAQAEYMEALATAPVYPNPNPPSTTPPTTTTTTGSNCGWINGVYYADRSGVCG